MTRLSVSSLGPLQVTLDGEPVTNFATDKARALLIYLAVEANRPQRQDALAGLLWPDQPQRKARQNLRQVLSHLRQAIGDQDDTVGLLSTCALERRAVCVDSSANSFAIC